MKKIELEIKKLLKHTKLPEEAIELASKDKGVQEVYKMAKKDAAKYLLERMTQGLQILMFTIETLNQAGRLNHRPTDQSEDENEAR